MKSATACVAAALALGHASVMAQPAGDSMDRLRACATLPTADRTKCLEQLSRALGPDSAPPPSPASADGPTASESWIFSETTSPLDYSPVAVATAGSDLSGSGMKLSIACRSGSTSLVLGSPRALPAGDRYVVWYTIDGASPKGVPAVTTSSGASVALSGDVVGLLLSLPPQGEIALRIVGRYDVLLEGRYSLAGLKMARERLAASCKWPPRADLPRR